MINSNHNIRNQSDPVRSFIDVVFLKEVLNSIQLVFMTDSVQHPLFLLKC